VQGHFAGLPPPAVPPQPARDAVRDPVQPAADRPALADGRGVPGEDEKGSLEGILGILLLP
jgi:hypothetical protein